MLFGDYTLINDDKPMQWSLWSWFIMIGWGYAQLAISLIFDPYIFAWTVIAAEMLIGIILYEVMVLGISFDDIM